MLKVGSHNYIRVGCVHLANGVEVSSLSGTALILDSARATLANSSIALSSVSGETALDGTFPNTVSLTDGTEYTVQATVTVNGSGVGIFEQPHTAKRVSD